MTIQKTLLRAFLLIGLLPTMLLAGLAFETVRDAMQSEIEHGLAAQADAISSNINKIMFERLQNAATWSTLEVMQDIQVRDVDKRLSNFLAKLKTGYGGVYQSLHVVDQQQMVVSSSNPGEIGQISKAEGMWKSIRLAGVDLTLEAPRTSHASGEPAASTFVIRAPILSEFKNEVSGELVLDFDWMQINSLLDSAASDDRLVALVDANGKIFAASKKLRDARLLDGEALKNWHVAAIERGSLVRDGNPVFESEVVVGVGRPVEFAGFGGIGLSTMIIQPVSVALAPVHRIALISLAILGAIVVLTLVAANKISGVLARPITALTAFTRKVKLGQKSPDMALEAAPSAGELGELEAAFLQMVQDIDNAQRDLVRASKLAVVGEMSSIIIHEVRTPLGIIKSSAQMLRRESGLSNEALELTGFIESETERLNRLVSAMLDSARPRALNKIPTDLHQLIHQSSVLLATQLEKGQIEISESLHASDAIVECDGEQITQVLLNLILNALQILPPGGKIQLASSQMDLIVGSNLIEYFCIEVSDNGMGIAAEDRKRIFDVFFCRREGGVGLGLAIVQQIILAHDGDIEAGESSLGGACFTIRLPRYQSNQSE
ncbi:two-component system sensor histidine kinase HydH [Oxalobacteraceae bacterium GrIS 2.11]